MIGSPPPEDLNAEWIWTSEPTDQIESYAFFRREFTLDETPGSADFWITGHTTYHVYINGRHFVRGTCQAMEGISTVSWFDIAYCLQIGRNSIAIAVHNTQVSRFSHRKKASALLSQLNLDGSPFLWTDENWHCLPGDCYMRNQPRLSRAEGFVESVDLRRYPHGWSDLDFDSSAWDEAQIVQPVGPNHRLSAQPDFDVVSEPYAYFNYYVIGSAAQVAATTHISFPSAIRGASGLYAAETYIHVQEDMNVRFLLFCDDPYYLIVDGNIIKVQGFREPGNWTDCRWGQPRNYLQDQFAELSATIPLTKGSTHMQILQLVGDNSSGASFVFPDTERESMRFLRGDDDFSFDGWNILGKLRLPFSHVSPSLDLSHLPKSSYYGHGPCDAAAHLMAYSFTAKEVWEDPLEALDLQQGDYAVLELEKYVRGCPEFAVQGTPGDVIDILHGEFLNGHFILPYAHDSRRVYTLVLGEEATRWQAHTPQGIKYLMIHVRQARESVQFQNISIRRNSIEHRNASSFTCSDELYNQIWEVGVNTLESTHDNIFLNSGCSTEGQLMADAMIQSLASIFVFGSYDYSERALREFAAAQYETGEIPAIAPSDYTVRLFDFGLLYPAWLHKHVLHSGNLKLLDDLIPHLQGLLSFYKSITTEDGLLLGNLEPPYDLPVLIDYSDSCDRKGVSTALNALYYNFLVKCEWLFERAGLHDEAQACLKHAASLVKAIRTLTWDSSEGLFADAWYDGKQIESYSMQANILALYAGLPQEKYIDKMHEKLFLEYAPFQTRIEDEFNENPYFKYFLLDMGFSSKNRDWAAEFMRYYWGKMIADGATTWWDRYCPDAEFGPENALSLCHGYGVCPNFFLITEITGIRPAEPGYSVVYFNPLLTAVEWCRAQISTPHGTIQVDWGFRESGELEILIDSNYELEVVPLLNPEIISDAIMHVSDEVVIAYPEERRNELDVEAGEAPQSHPDVTDTQRLPDEPASDEDPAAAATVDEVPETVVEEPDPDVRS